MSAAKSVSRDRLDEPVRDHLRAELVALEARWTVAEALAAARREHLAERIVYFYVVDGEGRLAGVLPIRRLLMAAPEARVEDLMVRRLVTLPEHATLLDACELFVLHKFLAIPVVDAERRPLGQIDVTLFAEEVLDLGERRTADDLFQLIGIHIAAGRGAGTWRGFADRFPWLLANVAGGTLCALLAGRYEAFLDQVLVLALFIPVVLALAESVSIQSMTITLQALHAGRTRGREFAAAVGREALVASLLGLASGCLVGAIAYLWKGEPLVSTAIGASIALSMLTASLLGLLLPTALRALRFNPRIASGPIVLALADLATLLFYFNLAGWLLSPA